MARDRKRAKQRRDRRERQSGNGARPRERSTERLLTEESTLNAPAPLEHGSGEADLAAAQLAVESGELGAASEQRGGAAPAEERDGNGAHGDDADGVGESVEELAPGPPAARPRPEGNRVAAFVRGSWTELQRVQWPDRRQVAQATGVVLGFVVIAGAFLGLADLVAGKLVDLII